MRTKEKCSLSDIQQLPMVTAVLKEVRRQCGDVELIARHFNTVVRCVDEMLVEFGKPFLPAVQGSGRSAWLASDDTGLSSKFMFSVLDSDTPLTRQAVSITPADADDFGRCSRLLDAVPEFRDRLPRLSQVGPEWSALVQHWSELEALLKENRLRELSEWIMTIHKNAKTHSQ